jgi:dipeptidyl-peptidase 4
MASVEHPSDGLTGAPGRVGVAGDGSRVVFLRAAGGDPAAAALWVYDVESATERLVADPRQLAAGDPAGALAIDSYAIDAIARAAVLTVGGQMVRADLGTGEVRPVPAEAPAAGARPDPTGQWIGYRHAGTLRVIGPHGDMLLAGEPDPVAGGQPHVSWGRAGWWWAPDGQGVLATRSDTRGRRAEASLHLLDLDGGWVDVHWDRETYPYLASVCWCDHGTPVVAVLRHSQQHGLVLAIDPRTGETQVHAELADPRWVLPVPGTPRHLSDGRVLVGGELAHDGYDARCLFADGTLLTPPSLYVRRVVGRMPGTTDLLVEASSGEPSEQHLYRVGTSVGVAGIDVRPVTTSPGWHRGEVGGDTLVIGSESLDHPGRRWTVWREGQQVGELTSHAPAPPAAPRPVLQRATDRRLPTGVLYPRTQIAGRRLPVLVDVAAGSDGSGDGLSQGVRATRQAWLDRQWWADAGFAVVVVDHRGTPGVAPSFEKVVHRRLADLALADIVDALAALAGKHTDLDLERVAIRGHGAGGWLAALAALRRPESFRCAVAEAPVVDWSTEEPLAAERYLGSPEEGPDVYQHHSLLAAAAEPLRGEAAAPVLLMPDAATAEPVRQLAVRLATTGRPHLVLPAAGGGAASSGPTPPAAARAAVLDFLRHHLGDIDRHAPWG